MSSPEGKNSNGSAHRLEAELAQARAEAEAAELKAKVLALEAKLQHQGSARAEALQDDLPVKKLPPAVPRGRVKRPVEKPAAKSKPTTPAAAAVAVMTKPSAEGPRPQQSAKPAVATSTTTQPPPAQPRAKDTATAAVVVAQPANDDDNADEDKRERLAVFGLLGLLGASHSWVWSMIVHLVALIVLGLIYLDPPNVDDLIPLVASMDAEEVDELEELPEETLEFDEIKGLAFDIEDPGMADFGQPELAEEMSEMDFEHVSTTIKDVGALFGESGKGWATAGTGGGGAEFYGVKTRGNKFVFVVDNSLSMGKGRFESACYELYYSVTKMAPDQEFYVLFFSDTAYALYHPTPAQGLVPADRTNKDLLARWLPTVQLVLRTDARKAVETALAMKPSGIYILTDGAFTDDTSQMLLQMPKGRTTIHTVGMEITGRQEETLKEIAEHHGGSYRHVRVDPQMKLKSQKFPIKRNSKPGPVWGIALGQPKPKKNRPQPGKGPNKKPGKKN